MNEELKNKIEEVELDNLISNKEIENINEGLENKKNQNLFITIGRWFVLVFLFSHILFFSWNFIDVLSDYGPYLYQGELILSLGLVTISLSVLFGVLKNKRWGYLLTIIFAVISGFVGVALGAFAGSSDSSMGLITKYLAMYAFFINPVIAFVTIIFSIAMFRKLGIQKSN